jgi:hypothetical protein
VDDEEIDARVARMAEGFSRSVGPALRFVLTVQAAVAEATPAQQRRMRKRLGPLLDTFRETGDVSGIATLIREVHGPGWRPTGETAEMINNLMGDSS